mgnify:CR=1 FL=1
MKMLTDLATPFVNIAEQSSLEANDNAYVHTLRLKALKEFNNSGVPAKKEEDWKYTSLWDFSQQEFTHSSQKNTLSVTDVEKLALLNQAYRIVIVDGEFSSTLSSFEDLAEGVVITSLMDGLAPVETHLGQQIDIEKAGFNALNTLMMNDGVVITVAADVHVEKPIELLVINSGTTDNLAIHNRHLIVLEKNSQATVIEHYVGLKDIAAFTNVVTEVVLAEQTQLNHYKLQQESSKTIHIATLAAKQAAGSQWISSSISLGAKLARNDVHTQLLGEQAHVQMDGLYLPINEQHVDFHTRIDHAVPNTTSEELFKGVLDDDSHAVFNGKVIVHKDAQKTDANQQNHNLLLSRACAIDSKPEMEIYADDVKCAHGSTVGQLNEDHLFFLRARGLDEVSARSLLTYAFAVDVLDRIENDELRQALSLVIEQRLPQGGQ